MKDLLTNIGVSIFSAMLSVILIFLCHTIKKYGDENPQPVWMGRYNP